MFLHRKAGELSVPEDSGMSTKSTWPHPETAMGARHTIETRRGRPGVDNREWWGLGQTRELVPCGKGHRPFGPECALLDVIFFRQVQERFG